MLNGNNSKIKDVMQEYNMEQLINEPTNFTEHSATLIDLILVPNDINILTSGVIDTFIPDQITYHCPVIVLLKFLRPENKTYKRKVWNYKLADFNGYREILSDYNLEEKVSLSNDIDENINCISEAITSAAEQAIPNKMATVRPDEHPWITSQIRRLIRKRERTYRKFKRTSNIVLWEKYKTIRNKIVSSIRKSKNEYFEKLDLILSSGTTNMKLFWKTSKQLLNTRKSTSTIPTLNLNNEHAETDIQRATMLNDYFTTQSTVIDDNRPLPQLPPVDHTLQSIFISSKEVKDVLLKLDISKACGPDLISPRLLKERACALAVPSYLTGRKQRVVLNSQASDWTPVQAGVPQGSILGPLLFLIYINDIVKDIGCSIRLFAVDTLLYIIVESPQIAANFINIDLSTISNWAADWLVDFNTKNSFSMILSRKLHPPQHPPLFMNNIMLPESDTHKHLGLTLSNSCTWSSHIKEISSKAWVRLNLMRTLKFKVSRKSLEKIYHTFIRPLLEYCDAVWDNCSAENKNN